MEAVSTASTLYQSAVHIFVNNNNKKNDDDEWVTKTDTLANLNANNSMSLSKRF